MITLISNVSFPIISKQSLVVPLRVRSLVVVVSLVVEDTIISSWLEVTLSEIRFVVPLTISSVVVGTIKSCGV